MSGSTHGCPSGSRESHNGVGALGPHNSIIANVKNNCEARVSAIPGQLKAAY